MTDLQQFASEHHVHYDVQPEFVGAGDDREPVGFEIRLFARHGGGRLGAPGCPACVELGRELASFAEQLVSGGEIASRTELVPGTPALYESTEERNVDEVELTVRVRCATSEHRRDRAGEDPCTRELRDRLAAAGVERR